MTAAFSFFSTVLGFGLLGLVAVDVYRTILHSQARAGPIGEALSRGVWRVARALAFRFSRARRHLILNAVGRCFCPRWWRPSSCCSCSATRSSTGRGCQPASTLARPPRPRRGSRRSISRASPLTTLGYGDISPRTTGMRLVALSEASAGFAFISLAITYLLTVTNALERKRAVALSFYHQAGQGADAAGFLVHHFRRGQFHGLGNIFASAARDLQTLLESHIEHPVIHYFHPVEVHKSLPRMLFLVLEIRSIMESCLDQEAYPSLCEHPEAKPGGNCPPCAATTQPVPQSAE